ncbi:MAG TPA: hypothetical protein VKW06_00275 [Candidatus Angelobacter sp.]|nr:hypothetical protein [Candidatus Angelobacter sp.]
MTLALAWILCFIAGAAFGAGTILMLIGHPSTEPTNEKGSPAA